MDFVRDDPDAVGEADFAHPAQLVFGPGATGRIMRMAQEKERDRRVFGLGLEIGEVDLVNAVTGQQGRDDEVVPRLLRCAAEIAVGGR
ncbi:hypothetical protein D3C80_1391060 [compost metagenome]